jgi:hypothetical protein
MRDTLHCCGARAKQSWDAGTRTHEPTCQNFKATAMVHLRSSPTSTTTLRKTIGDGYIYDSVEIRCSNGTVVNVYADGSVKQTAYDGSFALTGLPRPHPTA